MSLFSPSLEAFWAVVQKGTVLEAAKMIELTQTGVTQRIRSLEKQLGVTLFTRSRTGMRLTSEGESLLRYVQAARDLEGETLLNLKGKQQLTIHEVCISAPSTLMRSRFIKRVSTVLKKHPQLRVRLDLADSDDTIGKLKSGFAQIGALPVNQLGKELDSQILTPEKYRLFASTQWKKRKVTDIITHEPIVDFDPQDQTTLALLKKYKITKSSQHRHFANNIDALTSLVIEGVGYTALTEEFAHPLIKNGSLFCLTPQNYLESNYALAWYPRAEMPPYFKSLIDELSKKTDFKKS